MTERLNRTVVLYVCRELEEKLSMSERGREGAEQSAKELTEKNSRICSELEEIGDLVKQMERERETEENKLKESIILLQVRRMLVISTDARWRLGNC